MKRKVTAMFWSSRKKGVLRERVICYPNIFALLYNYLDQDKSMKVRTGVLKNNKVQSITTPYMGFFELAALCEVGEQKYVQQEMLNYWGGMLAEGATTFREEYDPSKKGDEHLAMYGSLTARACAMPGAAALHLGRYFLGVKPVSPGYKTFLVTPNLGSLKWIEGEVPTLAESIKVFVDYKKIKIAADGGEGVCILKAAQSQEVIPAK